MQRLPRVVLVTRPTQYELMLRRHGTAGQAGFFLRTKASAFAPAAGAKRAKGPPPDALAHHRLQHDRIEQARETVRRSIPSERRTTHIDRDDLDRFFFEPDDIVVAVGQDGLVPNVAKYLRGQPLIGINPDPGLYDGVLCRHAPRAAGALVAWATAPTTGAFRFERRVMAVAEREDGQALLALNEIFVGHRSHQSANYVLKAGGRHERQSSSGVICATGTGATGWSRSIMLQRGIAADPPAPEEERLLWFAREPFPSVSTGTSLDFGEVAGGESVVLESAMGEGGVIFADGIETDFLEFIDGQSARLRLAEHRLNLVVSAGPQKR